MIRHSMKTDFLLLCPTFLFSVWGHPRIPSVSKNMDASCRGKSNNGKRIRKRTQPIRFKRGNAIEIRNRIMFYFYPGLPHFIQISTTLLARFQRYRKWSILWQLVEVVCNTHFHLSPVSLLHLALATCVIFLMLRHSLCCLNFYFSITSYK